MNNGIFSNSERYIKSISNYGNTIVSQVPMPYKINNKLDWRILGKENYSAISSAINSTIADSPNYLLTRRRQKATFSSTALAYVSACLMADGRLFFCPFNVSTGLIYDPVSDRTFVPNGTYGGGASSYSSAVLLPNNEILLVPRSSACTIYNPVSNTIRTIGSAPGAVNSFNYGVLMGDGRVFCAPNSTNVAWIIDPVKNTIVTATGTYSNPNIGQINAGQNGVVLLPNGKVLTIPNGQNFFIYDPFLDKTTTIDRTGILAQGGLLLPDGKVLMGAVANGSFYIYDWERDIVRTSKQTVANSILGMVLLPDGRIFCLTLSTVYYIYNYFSDTISIIDGSVPANAASSACLVPDGRVVPHPRNISTLDIYGEKIKFFPEDIILNSFYNCRK